MDEAGAAFVMSVLHMRKRRKCSCWVCQFFFEKNRNKWIVSLLNDAGLEKGSCRDSYSTVMYVHKISKPLVMDTHKAHISILYFLQVNYYRTDFESFVQSVLLLWVSSITF